MVLTASPLGSGLYYIGTGVLWCLYEETFKVILLGCMLFCVLIDEKEVV